MAAFQTSEEIQSAMPKKRGTIVLIGALPPPYMGPTLATEILLKSTLTDRYRVIHLDTSDHRPLSKLAVIDYENIRNAVSAFIRLFWLLATHKVDIVYVQVSQVTIGYLRDSIYIIIARFLGRSVVTHLRGGYFRQWYDSCGPLMRWYVRRVHSLVNAQIVLGERLRALFDGIVDPRKVHVVPNGLNVPRPVHTSTGGGVRFLFLSNLMRSKGVLDFVRAAALVHAARPAARFMLAGASATRKSESCTEELETLLREHSAVPIEGLGAPHGEDKFASFGRADVFVLPTYYPLEGHPWVLVEAMAASLPIITCDQAAVAESVRDGINGVIVPQRDPQSLAAAMIRLIDEPETRQRMATQSRRLYEEHFTEEQMVARLDAVFQSVLDPSASIPPHPTSTTAAGALHETK